MFLEITGKIEKSVKQSTKPIRYNLLQTRKSVFIDKIKKKLL